MRIILSVLLFLSCAALIAQTASIPKEKVPEILLNQVRLLEADFVVALQKDCGLSNCYPRGCVYVSHEIVSLQGNRSLPGLSQEGDARSSGEPQYILTGLACEYVFERGIDKQEILNLNRRLESKLSKGALRVTLKAIEIPTANKEAPVQIKDLSIKDKLILKFIEYFSWILGALLVIAILVLSLWAWRRIGRDSKEEELRFMLYKKKLESNVEVPQVADGHSSEDPEAAALQARLVGLRERHDKNPAILQAILQIWMEEEQFQKVACSLLLLAEAEQSPFPASLKDSLASLRLGSFMQHYNPSPEERRSVLKELEQEQALKVHFDQTHLLRVWQLFSQNDGASLLARSTDLEARRALFALAPGLKIKELALALPSSDVLPIAQSFWLSPRVKSQAIAEWIGVKKSSDAVSTQEAKASWILGFLFSRLNHKERAELLAKNSGPWTEQIFYPEGLAEMSGEKAQDLLLSVDALALNHWYASLTRDQQSLILGLLPDSYRAELQRIPSHKIDVAKVMATVHTYGHRFLEYYRKSI